MFPKFCIFLIRHSPLNIVGTIERFKAEKLIFFSNFLGSKILLTGPLLFVFLNYEFPLVFFPSFPLFQKLATEPLFYFNWRIYFNCTVGVSSLSHFVNLHLQFGLWNHSFTYALLVYALTYHLDIPRKMCHLMKPLWNNHSWVKQAVIFIDDYIVRWIHRKAL